MPKFLPTHHHHPEQLYAARKQVEAAFDRRFVEHSRAIAFDTINRHQDRIRVVTNDVSRRLDTERRDCEGLRGYLATGLRLLADCATMYERTEDHDKRFANQIFY
ncbi:MAG: hypothetical protein E6Z13_09400 [Dermabacter sp.]|uniref:hypothetical protein n=1 Tax=Dermabacter hominis TaxID=36740 RepID=UPI00117B6A9E|nr:hypothetical protein [Dermabacter sp.]